MNHPAGRGVGRDACARTDGRAKNSAAVGFRSRLRSTMERSEVATAAGGASQGKVGRNFNWIWYLGAAVWFLNAALGMHAGALRRGLADAGISAVFLAVGIYLRRQGKRPTRRDSHR